MQQEKKIGRIIAQDAAHRQPRVYTARTAEGQAALASIDADGSIASVEILRGLEHMQASHRVFMWAFKCFSVLASAPQRYGDA
jgi:hypothetical protein